MRVAIVTESFLPNVNGVTNSVLRILEHLGRRGHEAMVVAPGPVRGEAAPTSHLGFPVHRVPAVMVPGVESLPIGIPSPGITAALRRFSPDVVHLASPFVLGAAGAHAARRVGAPAVAVFQTDVAGFAASYGMPSAERAAWRWIRALHSRCERTLAPSTAAMADLRAHGVPRVHHWGRGIDTALFAPSRRSEALRALWSPDGRPVVGFVGRLAPEKRVERLAGLAARGDLRVVIVGDGPERGRLAGLMPTAIFTGELHGDELATAYASLDVFVHAGEHETFCQAVQEALASGVPVIAPDAGGPRDLVDDGVTGRLLAPATFAADLPAAVDGLLEPEVRRRMIPATRASVLPRSWDAVCERLLDHHREAAGFAVPDARATA